MSSDVEKEKNSNNFSKEKNSNNFLTNNLHAGKGKLPLSGHVNKLL